MTDNQLDRLERIVKALLPQPEWKLAKNRLQVVAFDERHGHNLVIASGNEITMSYIEAFQPTTILELLALARRAVVK